MLFLIWQITWIGQSLSIQVGKLITADDEIFNKEVVKHPTFTEYNHVE